MPIPTWLREANPADLERRVQNLPLERLALGRDTLLAYRRALGVCALTPLPSLTLFTLDLIDPAAANPAAELALSLLVSVALHAVMLSFIVLRSFSRGWQDGQNAPLAMSVRLCQWIRTRWLTLGMLLGAGFAVPTWAAMAAIDSVSRYPMNSSIPEMLTVLLPVGFVITAGQIYEGLTGLLRGTTRAPRRRKTRRSLNVFVRAPRTA